MELYSLYDFFSSSPIISINSLFIFLLMYSTFILSKANGPKEDKNICRDILQIFFNDSPVRTILICLLSVFMLFLSSGKFIRLLGCTDLRIMPDGNYCYYVIATNENNKEYTLPASIEKKDDNYYVQTVYFSNGGYLYFNNTCEFEEYKEGISRSDVGRDQNDSEWNITLTNKKTHHKLINETNPSNSPWFVFLLSLVIIFCCIRYISNIPHSSQKVPINGQ